MAISIKLRNKEDLLKFVVNHRVLIFATFSLLLHIILIITVLASNKWITGSTPFWKDKPTHSFGLFKNCILNNDESEKFCASYESPAWLDGVKALIIIPLLILFLMTPVIFIAYLGDNGDEQVKACKAAYGTSFIAGTFLFGATRLFGQNFGNYPLRNQEFGWPFYLTIGVGGYFLVQILTFYPFYKLVPTFFDINQNTEETPEEVVSSNDVESAVATYDNKAVEKNSEEKSS